MLFGSRAKWWGDFHLRATCHEGLDICWFSSDSGQALGLYPGIQVPAMAAGRIMMICKDFLGQSILVEYGQENGRMSGANWRIAVVYSHVEVLPGICIGDTILQDQTIACLADTSGRMSKIPCHLHLSIMEINTRIPEDQLNWQTFVKTGPDLLKWYNPAHGL